MKTGKSSRMGKVDFQYEDGFAARLRSVAVLLVLVSVFSASCRRSTPPPPPPPPAAAVEPPPAPAPTITLTASPSSIDRGGSATLEWQSRNAGSVQIEPGVGAVSASGSQVVSPMSSVTYTATATGPGGTSTDTVRVTVSEAAAAAPPALPSTPNPSIEELFDTNVQPIFFDYDRSEIRADQVGKLQANARFLQQNADIEFTISGHADERGSQEYNIGLGDRRANAVRQFLIQQGIRPERMNTVSFGEERPVCRETTEACYQRNRRAEFALR